MLAFQLGLDGNAGQEVIELHTFIERHPDTNRETSRRYELRLKRDGVIMGTVELGPEHELFMTTLHQMLLANADARRSLGRLLDTARDGSMTNLERALAAEGELRLHGSTRVQEVLDETVTFDDPAPGAEDHEMAAKMARDQVEAEERGSLPAR